MSDPANPLSSCENCGVQFEPAKDEVVSSRVLCPKCAAERRAKLKAAKAAAAAGGAPAAAASASVAPAARPATPRPAQPAAAPAAKVAQPAAPAATATRSAHAASEPPPRAREGKDAGKRGAHGHGREEHHPHHDPNYDPRKHREEERKKIMRLAWIVTGSLSLIVGVVLLVVFNKHDARATEIARIEKELNDFRDYVIKVDPTNEVDLKAAKERINAERKLWRGSRIESDVSSQKTRIDQSLSRLIETRGLTEKLNGIETQLGGSPTLDILGKLYADVRNTELTTQSTNAGGEFKSRHDRLMKAVNKAYIDNLRAAATAASSATTGEALAPFGTLEDVLFTVKNDAILANDVETQGLYTPMWKQVYGEVNGITTRLFDEAYQNKIAWTDLLADPSGWNPGNPPASFKFKFGAGLTMTNEPDGSTGGLAYFPKADNWRDYVIDMEVKLDSGQFNLYVRIGDKMDSKECPALTVFPSGAKNPNVNVEYGKTYQLLISVISNQLVVKVDGQLVYQDDIQSSKSRKGEPGIAVPTGTNLTINRLKVRHLR